MDRKQIKEALAYERALLHIYKDAQLKEEPEVAELFQEYVQQSEKRIKELRQIFNLCLGG